MANYTGANVINAGDASNYQADIYTFGIGAGTSEVAFFITQTTNDILRQLKRAGAYLFMYKYFLPSLTKFRPETEKDRFERMAEHYASEYNKEWRSILEDGVEYDSDASGTIAVNEREPLHGYRRLNR